MLDRLVQSLIDTAGPDPDYQILVAIDDDDPAWPDDKWLEWEASLGLLGHVEAFRWPRPLTLGEKLNRLAQVATGDVFWCDFCGGLHREVAMDNHSPRRIAEGI